MDGCKTSDWILSQTMQLSDGNTEKIFTVNERTNKGDTYNCQLCQASDMSLECLMIHIAGRKHKSSLNVEAFDAEEFRRFLGDMRPNRFRRKCLEYPRRIKVA